MGEMGPPEAIPGNEGFWRWWKYDTCFMEVNPGYLYNVLIQCAQMTVEYIRID